MSEQNGENKTVKLSFISKWEFLKCVIHILKLLETCSKINIQAHCS